MKYSILSITLATGLVSAASAAVIVGTTYSYDVAPGFSGGGGLYLDDIAGTSLGQTNTPFTNGDLNDGVIYNGVNPVTDGGGVNSMLAWDPAPGTPATITFDLGGLYRVDDVVVTGYAWSPFELGQAPGVTISYSTDNISYGAGSFFAFASGDGAITNNTGSTSASAQYVRLAFDGTTQVGNKYGLTEVAFDGIAVPEPSSTALLGLGGLALILRRRK